MITCLSCILALAMAQTRKLINSILPPVLADVVGQYFRGGDRSPFTLGQNGEYEDSVTICERYPFNIQQVMRGACKSGHIEIVRFLLELDPKNPIYLASCLRDVFADGMDELARLLITSKTSKKNLPIAYACMNGDLLVFDKVRIIKTISDFAYCLGAACLGSQTKIIETIINRTRGEITCPFCKRNALAHLPKF